MRRIFVALRASADPYRHWHARIFLFSWQSQRARFVAGNNSTTKRATPETAFVDVPASAIAKAFTLHLRSIRPRQASRVSNHWRAATIKAEGGLQPTPGEEYAEQCDEPG